eukprot:TRINITY_DN55475_c0_g1_i1.p1 TRINITY_DN55475_c0_g1~~TRINITY_DN55475_c0_g1_i1.p1  ORF type:complete len:537 (-),score=90.65 TRINITY_DN55475_c0_g1_i1:37-1599(-)
MDTPVQMRMDSGDVALSNKSAYQALSEAGLVCDRFRVDGFAELDIVPGEWSYASSLILQGLCCFTLRCCCTVDFFVVDPGCVRNGRHTDGTDLLFGPGVHVISTLYRKPLSKINRVSDTPRIISGVKGITTVKQGFVALVFEKGEPLILLPGIHYWDNPDICFHSFVDLSEDLIKLGPYTLVTVEECRSAITADNGKQRVLHGGKAYMLTHQNWKFQAWLSQKMQTNKFGPLKMTTGDNITLDITVNVTWIVEDAVLAAARNVDLSLGDDTLTMIRSDVILQITSSIASFIGSIQYGSKGTATLQQAVREGGDLSEIDFSISGIPPAETKLNAKKVEKSGREALFDQDAMVTAVSRTNEFCERYGVKVFAANIISAVPSEKKLVEVMTRGAVASVAAEETAKSARAETNALLITAEAKAAIARAEAEATLIKVRAKADSLRISARADADAEKIRATGSKDAGVSIGESSVAVSLAKLKIAYGPFQENQSSTYFFGLEGPGQLPQALLGNALAGQTGALAM